MVLLALGCIGLTILVGISLVKTGDKIGLSGAETGYAPVTKSCSSSF